MRRKANKANKPIDGKKAMEQKRIVGIGDWHAERTVRFWNNGGRGWVLLFLMV